MIGDIMTPAIIITKEDTTIAEAAKKMRELDVGALVVESDSIVAGILTDRDIVTKAVAEDKDLFSTFVYEIMTPNPVMCSSEDSIETAAKLFAKHQIRRLLVKDPSGNVVGILSLGDLAVKTDDPGLLTDVFRRITESGRDEKFHMRRTDPEAIEQLGAH